MEGSLLQQSIINVPALSIQVFPSHFVDEQSINQAQTSFKWGFPSFFNHLYKPLFSLSNPKSFQLSISFNDQTSASSDFSAFLVGVVHYMLQSRQYSQQNDEIQTSTKSSSFHIAKRCHLRAHHSFGLIFQNQQRSRKSERSKNEGAKRLDGMIDQATCYLFLGFQMFFLEGGEGRGEWTYKLWEYVQFLPQYQIKQQMSALKQIKQKLADIPESSTELDLSKINIGKIDDEIKKALEKYKKITILILADCGLETLDNLPNWKLSAIEISNNKLGDSCLSKLASITTLTQIISVNNRIESLDALKQLASLKKLQEVDFSENPVAEKSNYRSTLFDSIKSLQIVDQKDVNGHEVEEEEEYDDEDEYDEDDEEFEGGDEEDDDYEEEEESSEKPKKKRK